MARCKATTTSGKRCGNKAQEGSEYCWIDSHCADNKHTNHTDRGVTYPSEDIKEALVQAKGIVSVAAEIVGCGRQVIYNRMEKEDDVREAREGARDTMVDTAENALHDLITNPDHKDHYKALRYYLSTQGKKRGYGDNIDITTGGEQITGIQFVPIGESQD